MPRILQTCFVPITVLRCVIVPFHGLSPSTISLTGAPPTPAPACPCRNTTTSCYTLGTAIFVVHNVKNVSPLPVKGQGQWHASARQA